MELFGFFQTTTPVSNHQEEAATQLDYEMVTRPPEFYVLVEYDRDSKLLNVVKITKDKSEFFDFPSNGQDPKDHQYVQAHPQFKSFMSWIRDNKPDKKEKYVRNLKFFDQDKEGNTTPESKFYVNGDGKFRMKLGSYQLLATPEKVYQSNDTSINLNYTGQELLAKFAEG